MIDGFVNDQVMQYLVKQGGLEDQYQLMDNVSRSMGTGSEFSRYQDIFYGLNNSPSLAPLPTHREMQGLVLFTRPNLNLSYDNIAPVRHLAHLLVQDPTTYQYAVRMLLDPTTYKSAKTSQLVDRYNPYITLLTNTIASLSNPPDIGIHLYQSPEGQGKEVWIMNDSISDYNGYFDLTATFNNPKGNAVLLLIHSWLVYMGALRVGPCIPHYENRWRDEMDYFTRIERYKFDHTGRKIEQWFHTGAAVPTNISIGAGFGFNREEALEMENKQLSVQFGCVGAVYNDPIQLYEFNMRMIIQNPRLADSVRNANYQKVERRLLPAVNYRAYPFINLATAEMDWYVDKSIYPDLVKGL